MYKQGGFCFFLSKAKDPFSWYGVLTYDSSETQHKLFAFGVSQMDTLIYFIFPFPAVETTELERHCIIMY